MKVITTVLPLLIFASCIYSKETIYTASTPASSLVREFLGISMTDSIDFIRWKLSINDRIYSLECNYGIGKPNTNGFYNGGKKLNVQGTVKKDRNYFTLQNSTKK